MPTSRPSIRGSGGRGRGKGTRRTSATPSPSATLPTSGPGARVRSRVRTREGSRRARAGREGAAHLPRGAVEGAPAGEGSQALHQGLQTVQVVHREEVVQVGQGRLHPPGEGP